MTRYRVSRARLHETFAVLKGCGGGRRECQALWISPWSRVRDITEVAHPQHAATAVSFDLHSPWLTKFWTELALKEAGVRIQIHTHPGAAFHSSIDDAYPIVQSPGFLSLVIPNFAQGPVGFEAAHLAQLQPDGSWRAVKPEDHIEIVS